MGTFIGSQTPWSHEATGNTEKKRSRKNKLDDDGKLGDKLIHPWGFISTQVGWTKAH